MNTTLKQFVNSLPQPIRESSRRRQDFPRLVRGLIQPAKLFNTLVYHSGWFRLSRVKFAGLNIGSGGLNIKGFLNIDADLFIECDVISGLGRLKIATGSVGCIYASHLFEHIPQAKAIQLLREWFRVLKPGGQLFLCVPDLEALAHIYLDSLLAYDSEDGAHKAELTRNVIYGGQTDKFDFHYSGYSFATIRTALNSAGFQFVERFNRSDLTFAPFQDGGYAVIGKIPISLNVVATK